MQTKNLKSGAQSLKTHDSYHSTFFLSVPLLANHQQKHTKKDITLKHKQRGKNQLLLLVYFIILTSGLKGQ